MGVEEAQQRAGRWEAELEDGPWRKERVGGRQEAGANEHVPDKA